VNALLLLALGLADAAFAGFRASAGRDARIRKAGPNARAAARGAAVGVPVLALTAALAGTLLLAGVPYASLDAAAHRMLTVYVPYAAVVAASLACYFWGPFRAGTLAVVAGLGPLTLLRPLVVAGGAVAAAWGSGPGAAVALVAAAGVLLVEPVVHRRWYPVPL
jgi:hypothetical protein